MRRLCGRSCPRRAPSHSAAQRSTTQHAAQASAAPVRLCGASRPGAGCEEAASKAPLHCRLRAHDHGALCCWRAADQGQGMGAWRPLRQLTAQRRSRSCGCRPAWRTGRTAASGWSCSPTGPSWPWRSSSRTPSRAACATGPPSFSGRHATPVHDALKSAVAARGRPTTQHSLRHEPRDRAGRRCLPGRVCHSSWLRPPPACKARRQAA